MCSIQTSQYCIIRAIIGHNKVWGDGEVYLAPGHWFVGNGRECKVCPEHTLL